MDDHVSTHSTVTTASRIRFVAGEEVVRRFSELTGDVSSLHTDVSFARRSAYRQPVVHGMLPIALLPTLPAFGREGLRCFPVSVSGRFSAPVFFGDRLRLEVDGGDEAPDSDAITFSFRVLREDQDQTATTGVMSVVFRAAASDPPPPGTALGAGLLLSPPSLSSFGMEGIEVGMEDNLEFRVSTAAVRSYLDLLEEALPDAEEDRLAQVVERFHLPGFLPILLFSTSVGVCLPGASATFLEFSAHLGGHLSEDRPYRLLGTVSHRSRATAIVKKKLRVDSGGDGDQPLLEGKVSSLVNKASARMPTLEELRDTAWDPDLKDKVVLVTGASRGIGETIAKLFSLHGALVAINYHRGKEDAARVTDEIRANGGEAASFQADVTDREAVMGMVREIVDRYGTIDILVNNAARNFRPTPFLDLSWEEVQRDLDVCTRGAFHCCKEVIPEMLRNGAGKIVNISSVATDIPPPNQTKYVVAKSALVGLTRSLAVEFASRNIQVNMVVPSFVETDLVAHVQEGFRKKIAEAIPMKRLGSPIDVARAVIFLSSAHSSFTTGQKLMVTGGAAPLL